MHESDLKCTGGKRVNVDRRWWGTSVVRIRVLAAGLLLLAAGWMLLGPNSRLGDSASSVNAGAIAPVGLLADAPFRTPVVEATPTNRAPSVSSVLSGLPLVFEPNRGQANLDPADPRAAFIARTSGYTLLLGTEGAIITVPSPDKAKPRSKRNRPAQTERFHSVQMRLAGANPNPTLTAADPLPGKSNYLLGNDPAKWRTGIPQFARVRYENVYPGINLVFYGNQGRIEYDFQVAPGSDPAQAELKFDGADSVELKDGAVVIKQKDGDLRLEAPRVYQQIAGREQPVDGAFVLRAKDRVAFAIGPYDHTRELVIDPALGFSTYFGGALDEHNSYVAVDAGGNIYLAGSTDSPTLPPGSASVVFQTGLKGTRNVYLAKITPSNPPTLDYVTYLGGTGTDTPTGIAVDAALDPYVAGTTSSVDFPTTATAYLQKPEPGSPGPHVFVTKLNPAATTASGQLVYSTYLSGNGSETATGMTIDGGGNLYVTGTTTSTDMGSSNGSQFPASSIPYATPLQDHSLASIQFFVTKVNTNNAGKSSIAYSTYFGGANSPAPPTPPTAIGGGIAVDTNLNIYFSGTTNFTYTNGAIGDFPILNAYQPCLNQTPPIVITPPPVCSPTTSLATDAFVAKITPPAPNGVQGQQLQWSTYFGGSGSELGNDVALDSGAAHVYLVGTTNSTQINAITTIPSYQRCLNNLPPTPPNGIVSCTTQSGTIPNDAFVAQFTNVAPSTTTTANVGLTYFSYLGGAGNEAGQSIAVDTANGAVVTGLTTSVTGFPVAPANSNIQSNINGPQNAFIARLNTAAVTGQNTVATWASYFGGNGTDQGTSVTLDSSQNIYFAGDTSSTANLQVTGLQTANAGGFDAFVTQLRTAASMSISGVLTLGTNQTFISAGNPATFSYTLTNGGPDTAFNLTVTDNLANTGWPVTLNSATASSGTCSAGSTSTGVVCTIPSLQAGSTATVTVVLTPTASTTGSQESFNGGQVQVLGQNNIILAQTTVSAHMSDFTLAVSPPNNQVAAAGATATYQVQLTPNPVYSNSIALTCAGVPTGAACTFTQPSVTLQGTSPGATTLNISTTARPITANLSPSLKSLYALWLLVPGLAFLGVGLGKDRRRRRVAGFLMLCALLSLSLLLPACSHSTTQIPVSGTPSGTSTITVTATAGGDVKSQAIKLTVP